MAVDELLFLKGEGNVDVQIGGPGQSAWTYLSQCASMGGMSVPKASTEKRYCQDADQSGKFVKSSTIETTADDPSGEITTKLSNVNYLADLDCPFSLRARFAKCGARNDPNNYDLMLTVSGARLTSEDYDDLAVTDPGNNDEILITMPWTGDDTFRVADVGGGRAGSLADLGDIAINDWAVCDTPACAGYCGARKDGCSVYHGVTDLDTTPYAWPMHIQGIKDVLTDVVTWSLRPILGVNGNVESVTCAGDRVIVSCNSASLVAYNETYDDDGFLDQDEWNLVAMTHAPAAGGRALFARTTREIWIACADGYVGKSTDGGESWTYTSVGTALNAVFAYDADLIFAVGNTGEMYRSTDGGTAWTDITEVATTAANLLVVKVPPGRSREVYVGTNDGQVFKSTNQGATFSAMAFAGDEVGSVDDLDFAGFNGDVLWILHNDAGPRGRILRDLSGGYGGSDVEVAVGYTDLVAAGVQLNALVACDENVAWAAGEVSGGYPMVVKVS